MGKYKRIFVKDLAVWQLDNCQRGIMLCRFADSKTVGSGRACCLHHRPVIGDDGNCSTALREERSRR